MAITSINGNTDLQTGTFPPCRVASTGSPLNPSTGGLMVVDGVQLAAGDRVLCKDETSAVNNGIYAANTGPWVRTADAGNNNQFFSGMAVTVALGAVNAGQTFLCTCPDDPVVIGTSLITFATQQAVQSGTQQGTSTTSLTIGTGSKTFTTQSGLTFKTGQWVLAQETSNNANQMYGQVTSYSGTSLALNVTAIGGSGTHADWTLVLSNSAAAAGYQPPVGTGNVTGPGSSTAGHVATFADTSGKVLQDGGTPIGAANTVLPAMLAQSAVALGCNMLNGQIVASVSGNALTLTIETFAGNVPSSSDPVWLWFRSATPASGAPTLVEVTSALSVTIPAGSTIGFANATPGRLWLVAVNNGGTVSLAVINCLSVTNSTISIYPLAGQGIASITAFGGGANNAQVFYGANSIASVPYSVIGFATYEAGSTLGTAGAWSATPTRLETYRSGVPLPGSRVQISYSQNSGGATSGTTSYVTTGLSVALTPTSSTNVINLVSSSAIASATTSTPTTGATTVWERGSTSIGKAVAALAGIGGSSVFLTLNSAATPNNAMDFPASLSLVTYTLMFESAYSTATFEGGTASAEEIQA